jgi:sulfate adenylyltransferase subunit 1
VLVDARLGVIEQTKRHSIIASLFKIPHIVVAINKMDLVEYSQEVYNNIVIEYSALAKSLGLNDVKYIPISALNGDNIVERSENLSWYTDVCLLDWLETVEVSHDINLHEARFPVQLVIRPQTEELHDYRGYAGKITSGIYRKGDAVTVLPVGITSKIKSIEKDGKEVSEAFAPQSVVIQLEDDIDISRGDLISRTDSQPTLSNELQVLLCWMDTKPLIAGNKYYLQLNSRLVRIIVKEIEYKLDVNSLEKDYQPTEPGLNDIVKVTMKAATPLPYDPYTKMRGNGGGILIDETSNATVAACLLL